MTLRTGSRSVDRRGAAFTLIELILVMAMLMAVVGVGFPTLKGFFKGRNLDSEARRLLSLTIYGRSRAVSEGVPVLLWIDGKRRSYGLEVQAGYLEADPKAVEYTLDEDLEIEADWSAGTQAPRVAPVVAGRGSLPAIRFMPDGLIATTSPDRIILRQDKSSEIWIVGDSNRLSYAIQIDPRAAVRR